MSTVFKPPLAVAVILCSLVWGAAQAQEPGTVRPAVAADAAANPLGGKAIDRAALAQQRGGSDASLGDMKLNGSVIGNSASNLNTGNNIITDGALSGASGVPMVVQNSGNNVLIQSATIINVTVK